MWPGTTEALMAANVPAPQENEPRAGSVFGELQPTGGPALSDACPGRPNRTLMRQQVIDLILDIISATDPQSEVRQRLLRHLAAHPGCPEQALLCHLRENSGRPMASSQQ
jgi:hypothetical protein